MDGLQKDMSSYSRLAIMTWGESLNVLEALFRGWQRLCSRDCLCSVVGKAVVGFGINGFGSTYQLCNLGQVTWPPAASVSPSGKWDDNRTHLTGME